MPGFSIFFVHDAEAVCGNQKVLTVPASVHSAPCVCVVIGVVITKSDAGGLCPFLVLSFLRTTPYAPTTNKLNLNNLLPASRSSIWVGTSKLDAAGNTNHSLSELDNRRIKAGKAHY